MVRPFPRSLVAVAGVAVLLGGSAPALAAPVTPTMTVAVTAAGTAGYCPDATGVTVAVDFQELGGGQVIRCAPGAQATGLAALENAGFTVTGTDRWGKAFVCRINGKPGTDTEPCKDTPPASAYWGYWYASNGGSWTYSQLGASNRKPPQGSFEGWSFSLNRSSTTNPPPRVTPTRPAKAARSAVAAVETTRATHTDAGVSGGRWLAGELVDGKLPGFAGTDWGLTIDALLGLVATGADTAAAGKIADAIDAEGAGYYTFDSGGQPAWIGGATAKTLVAAIAAGRDPKRFTGRDLRQATLDLIAADGENKGQLQSRNTGNAGGNTFDQSLGVLGLARSGGVPVEMVDFLKRQQCPAGGFRLGGFGNGGASCTTDSDTDPDSTAMAVQALLEAGQSGVDGAKDAADRGGDYLVNTQRTDGSFGGSGPTTGSNSNSTGLAGEALLATGHSAEADRAADWVLDRQLSADNAGPLTGDLGAIAYNDEGLSSAKTDVENARIPELSRDQWRRSSAQAMLGLAKVTLGRGGEDAGPNPNPGGTSPDPGSDFPGADPVTTPGAVVPGADQAPAGGAAPEQNPAAAPEVQPRALAQTGAPIYETLLGAMVLLALGMGLAYAGRRREAV